MSTATTGPLLVSVVQLSLSRITRLSLITGMYERARLSGVPCQHFQTSSRGLGPHPLRAALLSQTTEKHSQALPHGDASRGFRLLGSVPVYMAFSVIGVGGTTIAHRQERQSESVRNWLTGSLLLRGGGWGASTDLPTARWRRLSLNMRPRVWELSPVLKASLAETAGLVS